MTLEDRTDRKS